jgi:uncharacterized protein
MESDLHVDHDCIACGLVAVRQDWIEQLVDTIDVEVAQVILFGSRARGEHVDSSDYDLVVVSADFEGVPPLERAYRIQRAWTGHRGLDAIGLTPEELRSGSIPICDTLEREGRMVLERRR